MSHLVEAGGNALATGNAYELTITLDDERCNLDVIDHGRGFTEHSLDVHATGESPPEASRGLTSSGPLVDLAAVDTVSEEHGGVVHIVKRVASQDQSPWLPNLAPSDGCVPGRP